MNSKEFRETAKTDIFNITPKRYKALGVIEVLNFLDKMPGELLDYSWIGVAGIQWSLATGRLNGNADMKIRALTFNQLLRLIYRITINCESQNDVPIFLNETVK